MSERIEQLIRELQQAVRDEVGRTLTDGAENVGTLAEEVKRARASAQLSLQELADRSGFTKSHVWEVEQGRAKNPTVGLVAGLSRALGVPFLILAQAALHTQLAEPPHA